MIMIATTQGATGLNVQVSSAALVVRGARVRCPSSACAVVRQQAAKKLTQHSKVSRDSCHQNVLN